MRHISKDKTVQPPLSHSNIVTTFEISPIGIAQSKSKISRKQWIKIKCKICKINTVHRDKLVEFKYIRTQMKTMVYIRTQMKTIVLHITWKHSTTQFYCRSFRNAETSQAPHSFIHSVTLRKLSTCTTSVHWSAAAGTGLQSLLAKGAATLQRENNSYSDQNSPQPIHLHARHRVLFSFLFLSATDNNTA